MAAEERYMRASYQPNSAVAPRGSMPRRRKKKRKPSTLLFSLGLLVLLGAGLLIYQAAFQKRASTVEMTATPISTNSTYLNTGDGLLYQTDGQIHFYHLSDEKKNYTYGMGASDIRMSGSESMTVVFNSASLQVVGKEKPVTLPGRILDVSCGKGYLAILQRGDDGSEAVRLQTPDGQECKVYAFVDQFVVDFGFYSVSGERLWIETLSVNAGTPATMIYTYDLGKLTKTGTEIQSGTQEQTGMVTIQNQLVDDLYITQNSIFVAATNQIFRFTHDGNKEAYRMTVYGYEVVDFSSASDSPTFLLTPRGGDFHSVKILTLEEGGAAAEVETYLQLPTEGVDAFIMGSSLVVASREKLLTYSLKGKLSAEAMFEQPIDAAVKLTNSILMVSSNGTYYLVKV